MIAGVAADAVLLIHFLFILFALFGGLLALRWPRIMYLHVPAALWGMVVEWTGWPCPLTPLEQILRRVAGQRSYEGGFIENYLWPLIYPAGLTREIQLLLGVVVLVMNVLVYGLVLARLRARRVIG